MTTFRAWLGAPLVVVLVLGGAWACGGDDGSADAASDGDGADAGGDDGAADRSDDVPATDELPDAPDDGAVPEADAMVEDGDVGDAEADLPILGTAYYVDSVAGSASDPGTSPDLPWRTLDAVHARDFAPGDVIHFKRGGTWSGGLELDDPGTAERPIRFTAYGEGARPVFTDPGPPEDWPKAIRVTASWVIVEGFLVRDTHEVGVAVDEGADHVVVRDVEATNVGIGITLAGRYGLATGNYLHDLHMVRNTDGGDDDYGALGVGIFASDNEVSYNRMERCIAPSYDYGTDGGVVEWYGEVDNAYVHHNRGVDSNGFLEVGGGTARHARVAYNVSIDNGGFGYLHVTGTFASVVQDFRVENNTIVETADFPETAWVVFGFSADPGEDAFVFRNNVVWLNDFWLVSAIDDRGWRLTHDHNLFFLADSRTELGFAPGAGESVGDPRFADLAARDLHLLDGSPAIDGGVDLGWDLDFDGRTVPAGGAPDLGAFEHP
jgi:hypothetical protein